MTRLFLFRHGETISNIEQRYQGSGNSHLSELGISQAQILAKSLQDESFSAIYSSTQDRSVETARIIAAPHNLTPTKVAALCERNYGDWEGLTFTDIKEKYSKIYATWLVSPAKTKIPKAESLEALQKRGVQAISGIVAKHPEQSVAVVGHGGMNRVILFHYMNLELDNFWRIKQDNCCVNIIDFEHLPRITLLNSTWFLGERKGRQKGYY